MSMKTIPGLAFFDRGIPSMSTEYGITCEIGGEASLGGGLGRSGWSKISWSSCDM
jgi:hypothetical protein